MKIIRKISYLLLALSLLPILSTYFAYGNVLDLMYFVVTFVFFIGLLYLLFITSPKFSAWMFRIGIILFLIQFFHLKNLWFNNKGGDVNVILIFTSQTVFIAFILWLLFKESTPK